jgi:hypothetical protein
VSIRFTVASISAVQGPAKLADIDAANATALNASIVTIFMGRSRLWRLTILQRAEAIPFDIDQRLNTSHVTSITLSRIPLTLPR